MAFIRSLLRATATASAISAERAKAAKITTLIAEAAAELYASADASFAPLAAHENITDAAARVACDPRVIAAARAVDDLSVRVSDALTTDNPDYELTVIGAAATPALDELGNALRSAYLRVLLPDQVLAN